MHATLVKKGYTKKIIFRTSAPVLTLLQNATAILLIKILLLLFLQYSIFKVIFNLQLYYEIDSFADFFPVDVKTFFRATFLKNTCEWLLLLSCFYFSTTVSEWNLPTGSGVFRTFPNIYDGVFLPKLLFSEIKTNEVYLDKGFTQIPNVSEIFRASYGKL